MPITLPRIRSPEIAASRQPSSEFFSRPSSYSFPSSSDEFSSRIRQNVNHFRANYFGIVFYVLLVSELLLPLYFFTVSVFIVMVDLLCMNWFRKHHLVVLNRLIDGMVVILTMVILSDVALLALAGAWLSVLVSFMGVGMVVLHAAFRKSEDLFLDEEEAVEAGLVSVVGSNDGPSEPATGNRS